MVSDDQRGSWVMFIQFERIDGIDRELGHHASDTARHEFGPGVDANRIIMAFNFCENAFGGLQQLGTFQQM